MLVSTSVLYIILSRFDITLVLHYLKNIQLSYFITASLLFILSSYISAIRWRLILHNECTTGALFRLNMVGVVFNNLLPGSIGGDSVRLYYLAKQDIETKEAACSIILDRYAGFLVLIFLGLTASLYDVGGIKGTGVEWALPLISMFFLAFSFLFFGTPLLKKVPLAKDFYSYFHTFLKRKRVVLLTLFLSVFIQLIVFLSVYIISVSLKVHIPLTGIIVILPIVITLTTIPISIAGVGIREGAFILLFGKMGVSEEEAIAVSLCWFLSVSATGILGLYYYMITK